MTFPIPKNDEERVKALKSFEILDTDPEKEFDELCALASEICNTPISYVSLIDNERQWFKSTKGIKINECPRDLSICSYALNFPDKITEIPDARIDEKFSTNPSVTGELNMVFYASAPLVTIDGYPIGTICVLDKKPNKLTNKQKNALKVLSRQVIKLLELRVKNDLLDKSLIMLENKNLAFENFTKSSLDSITSPINTINVILEIIKKRYTPKFDKKAKEYFNIISESSVNMTRMIKNIKEYHGNLDLIIAKKESFVINELFNEIKEDTSTNKNILFQNSINKIYGNKKAIKAIISKFINHTLANNFSNKITIEFNSHNKNSTFYIKTEYIFDSDFKSATTNLCTAINFQITFNETNGTSLIELSFK